MNNLSKFGVQELNNKEIDNVNAGCMDPCPFPPFGPPCEDPTKIWNPKPVIHFS